MSMTLEDLANEERIAQMYGITPVFAGMADIAFTSNSPAPQWPPRTKASKARQRMKADYRNYGRRGGSYEDYCEARRQSK